MVSPTEQVVLEVPALRARRLVRLQLATIVVVSIAAALLGMLSVALPVEDRSLTLAALAAIVAGGGLFVGLTDFAHGRCVHVLIETASQLRQSAAERAADLARTNAELRRRDAERASLVAVMSHELRTPLGAILGFSRALLDNVDGTLNHEQRTDVAMLHQSASGLLGIVNRTLDFARLDVGGVPVTVGPVRLGTVAEEVVASLRPLAAVRGLDLEHLIPPALPPVEADEDCLRQVLTNLVSNAIKFTDVGRIEVRAELSEARVTIAVADTGIGIARSEHERIFEPFRQVAPGLVRGSDGIGLGLAICQRLLQLMDGRIWVESELGAGSTFSVSLPVAELRAVAAPAPVRAASPCDVVVVGDAVRTRPLIASLRSRGLEAKHASGPTWSLDLAAESPCLVLFDVLASRAAAWRVLTELRADPEHRERALGLFGLLDGGGRVVVPASLDLLADADLDLRLAARVQSLCASQDRRGRPVDSCVLVVSADMAWRRRVSLLLEARGIPTAEGHGAADAMLLARRVPVRGIVSDLLLPFPGIAELLTIASQDEVLRHLPVLLVGPGALSPSQQRDLRRDLMQWSREHPVPVSELAASVAVAVAGLSREAVTT